MEISIWPDCRELSVLGDDVRADFALLAADERLVFEAEVAAFGDQRADFGIVFLKLLVEPGQLGENLEVAEFLRAEDAAGVATGALGVVGGDRVRRNADSG